MSYLIKFGEKYKQNLPYSVFHSVLLRVHIVSSSWFGHQFILGGKEGGINVKTPTEFVSNENKINDNFEFKRYKLGIKAYYLKGRRIKKTLSYDTIVFFNLSSFKIRKGTIYLCLIWKVLGNILLFPCAQLMEMWGHVGEKRLGC